MPAIPPEELPEEEVPVTPPELPAGAPAGAGVGYKAVIYDQAGVDFAIPGKRRGIAPERFGAASWTIEARGGLGEFSLQIGTRLAAQARSVSAAVLADTSPEEAPPSAAISRRKPKFSDAEPPDGSLPTG